LYTLLLLLSRQAAAAVAAAATAAAAAAACVAAFSMPSKQIARLPAIISRPQQSEVSISPDTFQHWPFTRRETTGLALAPPDPSFINHMVSCAVLVL
jgi:hypothetical protein